MGLHVALHLGAHLRGRVRAAGEAEPVEPLDREVRSALGQRRVGGAGLDRLGEPQARGAAEDDEVDQAVRAQPIGAVDRDAGRLADREQAGHDAVRRAVLDRHRLAVKVGRDAAHIVVDGRRHRQRLAGQIDAGEHLARFGDPREAFVQDLGVDMVEVEPDMVLVRADAAALAHLDRHRARDDVAAGEVLGRGRVALHEALALASW